ncbi:MAG: DUF1501 domain-containing protein [Gemmataceae bacterium]|nr:DUF1501 domain-containing protein [Gemmataceae bacterium]MCI0739762.1 DUF1501 domain-containing protein [Gemmataceae bacterium]
MFTSPVSRRDMLKYAGAGLLGTGMSGWLNILATRAAQTQQRTKSCILLWMDGGPSHKDTFDLRPGTEQGGPYQAIDTNVPGIQISEHFPRLARLMNHGALIRSMSTGEGAHGRAKYYLHTGYKEGVGGLVYPALGSIASMEIGNPNSPLPNYVSIGNRSYGSGFLGPRHQPLIVNDPVRGVENLRSFVTTNQFNNRVNLLDELEAGFHRTTQADVASAHRTTYQRAVTLMRDQGARAFDIANEPEVSRRGYGTGRFADGCLLARRLIETGVTFVEVTLGGWDTHQNNFARVQQLSGQVDPAMSQLITDLRERGLLDTTLVIWMGEFGRTPRINQRGAQPGRDHYPRAWSLAMFGGGIRGGQVIGRTDAEAATVVERPVSTLDFMATVCSILGIDYSKQNQTQNGRPVRIVDRGANPITQLV